MSWFQKAVVAALLWVAADAAAMAGETPPERGVLLKMENGDVSCYLHLRTTTAPIEIVHAGFELCLREDLIGATVDVEYELSNVMAASCQGDLDCPHSDQVMLAVSMKRVAH